MIGGWWGKNMKDREWRDLEKEEEEEEEEGEDWRLRS